MIRSGVAPAFVAFVAFGGFGGFGSFVAVTACVSLRPDTGSVPGLDTNPDGTRDASQADVIVDEGLPDASRPEGASDGSDDSKDVALAPCPRDSESFTVVQAPTDAQLASGCVFATITEALDAARLSGAGSRLVRVGPGIYTAPAERFPLDLRGGISLRGASRETTIVRGAGTYDVPALADADRDREGFGLTVLVGDSARGSSISDLSFEPGGASHTAVACVEGTAVTGAADEATATRIERVVFDKVYRTAVVGVPGQFSGGCNLTLTSSVVRAKGNGVLVAGCSGPVAVRIGDGTEAGRNVFDGAFNEPIAWPHPAAVSVRSCVDQLSIRANTFESGFAGVTLMGASPTNSFSTSNPTNRRSSKIDIVGNTFRGLSNLGVWVYGGFAVDRLEDNEFLSISTPTAVNYRGLGIALEGLGPGLAPSLARARRNRFIGNDMGVALRGSGPFGGVDFGTSADPGGNVLACNGGGRYIGGDLVLLDSKTGAEPAHFYGNLWDHAPPTTSSSLNGGNGADIRYESSSGHTVDAEGASLANVVCPTGRGR